MPENSRNLPGGFSRECQVMGKRELLVRILPYSYDFTGFLVLSLEQC